MLIEIRKHTIVVRNEVNDPAFGKDDSRFLYHVKKALLRLGYDCIKKRAWKDGHLVDDSMQYIRDRKKRWFVHDAEYSIRSSAEEFDLGGVVYLRITSEDNSEGLKK